MVRCDSRSFTQSVTYFETDVASGSSAAIVSACLFVFRHLWLILVELLRQSPALLLQSVHRCESTREHQKWRLQHEAADYTSRQPHKWFRSGTKGFPRREDEECEGRTQTSDEL